MRCFSSPLGEGSVFSCSSSSSSHPPPPSSLLPLILGTPPSPLDACTSEHPAPWKHHPRRWTPVPPTPPHPGNITPAAGRLYLRLPRTLETPSLPLDACTSDSPEPWKHDPRRWTPVPPTGGSGLEHCFVMNEVFWRFGELSSIQGGSGTRDLQF